jgi:uncharacterized membrane protein
MISVIGVMVMVDGIEVIRTILYFASVKNVMDTENQELNPL